MFGLFKDFPKSRLLSEEAEAFGLLFAHIFHHGTSTRFIRKSNFALVALFPLLVFVRTAFVAGFVMSAPGFKHKTARNVARHRAVLTDRQLQFWEDVDEGLQDIVRKGENISRVLEFAKRARGEIPQVAGYAVGHEPSEEHIEGLTAKPFWATEDIAWAGVLEANSNRILDEFDSKLTAGRGDVFAGDSPWQNQVMGSGWSAIRLQRLGVWNPENCLAFPHTFELLQSLQIPLAVRGVCFARQAPRSGVQPHSDGRNFILTAHLGLKIPKGCWIQVGESENKREWSEGKLTIIDTSFRHSTSNPTDEDRHVLIIDFWHPELTDVERKALAFVYDTRNKFESGEVPFRMPRNGRRRNEPASFSSWWRGLPDSSMLVHFSVK